MSAPAVRIRTAAHALAVEARVGVGDMGAIIGGVACHTTLLLVATGGAGTGALGVVDTGNTMPREAGIGARRTILRPLALRVARHHLLIQAPRVRVDRMTLGRAFRTARKL